MSKNVNKSYAILSRAFRSQETSQTKALSILEDPCESDKDLHLASKWNMASVVSIKNLKLQRSEIRAFLRYTIAMKPGKAMNLNDKSWPDPHPPVETKSVAYFFPAETTALFGALCPAVKGIVLKQFYLFYDIAFLRL